MSLSLFPSHPPAIRPRQPASGNIDALCIWLLITMATVRAAHRIIPINVAIMPPAPAVVGQSELDNVAYPFPHTGLCYCIKCLVTVTPARCISPINIDINLPLSPSSGTASSFILSLCTYQCWEKDCCIDISIQMN